MANAKNYYVELRNSSGTTIGTHVYAQSEYAAMSSAEQNNPGFKALFARIT
jgi:hypothetical protein